MPTSNPSWPVVNVLTRTHRRPKQFAACRKSVLNQLHVTVRHLVITDCDDDYTEGDVVVRINGFTPVVENPRVKHGILDVNRYLPMLYPLIQSGWVMFLDDDDMFCHDAALADVLGRQPDQDTLYVGRTRGAWPGESTNVMPRRNKSWGKNLRRGNVCSCSYVFHSEYLPDATWRYRRAGDFHVVDSLQMCVRRIAWVDTIFTQLQSTPGYGLAKEET